MKLLQTTKDGRARASHFHFAYLNEVLGEGATSTDNKHSHRVVLIPPMPPQVDPMTGQIIQGSEPRWEVVESNGHIHDLTDVVFPEKKQTKNNKEIAKENRELFRLAESRESKSRKKAEKSEDFCIGDQWDKADKDALKATDRASLTINEIEAKVDLLSGYQRQNRSDFRFFPTEGGDAKVADILNTVVKNITDQNDYEFEETTVFEDEIITGRGNIHCYLDYKENIRGEIKIEHFPWRDVYYGVHSKLDGSDAEYQIKAKWYSIARVKQLWPEKEKDIAQDWETYEGRDGGVVYKGDQYDHPDTTTSETMSSFVSIAKKEYRVLEIERKEYFRIPVLADEGNDFYQVLEGLSSKEISAIESIPDISIVQKPETRMRRTVQIGSVILEDGVADDKDFSIIPTYAKKRGDEWWGKVESVKDVQLEINKRHSQSIDILNKNAGYGWFFDSNTYPTPQAKEKAKAELAKPGFHLEITDSNRTPQKIEGGKFPTELVNMMALDSQKIKELMNVNTEMLGMSSQYQSGYAMVEQKRQGLIGNEYLFDNLNRSKKRLGKKIIRLVKKIYTPERILRIIQSQNARKPIEVDGEPLDNYDTDEILAMLKNADLEKYDVAVSTSNFNPTMREANFLIWADLVGKGVQVPPDFLIEMSNLPEKEKAKASFATFQKMQQDQEKSKQQTEIQKTLIAKGIPPDGGQGTPIPA